MNCECGGDHFMAHQIIRHDIIVDAKGNFLADSGIYDSEKPYGPFTCITCGREYDELPKGNTNEVAIAMLKRMFQIREEL